MPTTDERAVEIRHKAKQLGLVIRAHDGIVTVIGRFTPGDRQAYIKVEQDAFRILAMFRQVCAGSTWGTTSDGVGGAVAIKEGRVIINKSGCEKRLAAKFDGN